MGAERLREVVSRQADAPFRQIEAELPAHRPAEPRISARFRRPYAFRQAAEHHAIHVLQARFQRAENLHARLARRIAHGLTGKHGMKQLGIVAARNGQRAMIGDIVEKCGEDFLFTGEVVDGLAVQLRDRGERMRTGRQRLQRRQRLRQ